MGSAPAADVAAGSGVDGVPAADGIGVAHVAFSYGARPALVDVSMAFPPATLTALVGPNGAGKSTLLDVLAGTITVDTGEVRTVARPAYVLQRARVPERLPLSVGEAVMMGVWARRGVLGRVAAVDRRHVADCLERLGIAGLARRPVGELSGGQHQRMLVAQGLAQRSPLLLLDEPVTGLDAVARQLILDAVADEVAAGTTVVMCTHELSDARLADQVALMVEGRVRACGPPADVLRAEVLAAAYGQVVALADGQQVVVLPASHHDHDHDHDHHDHHDDHDHGRKRPPRSRRR